MLTHPLRSLGRTPVFATAAALTLALGIGSVAAAFAIVYGVLLDPLPYGHPDRLVSVGLQSGELHRIQQPPAVYYTYKRFARRIEAIGFYRTGNANIEAAGPVDDAVRVPATWVTASTIPLLQVKPVLGRSFTEEEDRGGAPDVTVISESAWRMYFGGSPDVLGITLVVNSIPRQIIGVMPRQFTFPSGETKLWLPARIDRDSTAMGDFAYWGVARLSPGISPQDAERELASVFPRVAESFPRLASGSSTTSWFEQVRPAAIVVPLRDEITSGIARTLWLLAAAGGLVLFVALANVANLMLIRADARQLELAVREALGANRWRIATHFLGESLVLVTVAGAAALGAAWAAVRLLVAYGPADVPRLGELHLTAATFGFVVAMSVVAAIVCAIVPTIRMRRATRSINLRDGGRGETSGNARRRLRSTIAAFQLAVAFAVVAGSALLLRTFHRLNQERPGFDATNVSTVWTQLPFARYEDSAAVAFYARLTESVGRLPGVSSAGVTTRLPLGDGETHQLAIQREDGRTPLIQSVTIGGSYFSSLKIPLLAGRTFEPLGLQSSREVILGRRAVETLFGAIGPADAVGRLISVAPSGPAYTIIGVVGDVRDHDLATPPSSTAYMAQAVPVDGTRELQARRTMALVVKTSGSSIGLDGAIRRIVHDLDPSVPVFNVGTMSDIVRASTGRLSFILGAMIAAASITLMLGVIGLYGIIAYTVALRTRELGIRIALGADPDSLARSIVLRALPLVAGGVSGGLVLYAFVTPLLRGMLYGVTPADPATLVGALVALIVTASIGTWLPARRAARVDPAVALRAE